MIYDTKGDGLFGFIIINVNFSKLVSYLKNSVPKGSDFYLANQEGDFLVHPNSSKSFGFEFGNSYKMQDEFESFRDAILKYLPHNSALHLEDKETHHHAGFYSTLNLEQFGISRPLRVLILLSLEQHSGPIASLRNRSLVIAFSYRIGHCSVCITTHYCTFK